MAVAGRFPRVASTVGRSSDGSFRYRSVAKSWPRSNRFCEQPESIVGSKAASRDRRVCCGTLHVTREWILLQHGLHFAASEFKLRRMSVVPDVIQIRVFEASQSHQAIPKKLLGAVPTSRGCALVAYTLRFQCRSSSVPSASFPSPLRATWEALTHPPRRQAAIPHRTSVHQLQLGEPPRLRRRHCATTLAIAARAAIRESDRKGQSELAPVCLRSRRSIRQSERIRRRRCWSRWFSASS